MPPPLTREEFANAIQAGRGRAYLHVATHGLSEVADLVLDACLRDQSHDPQCEPSRANWLFDMVRNSVDHLPSFSASILAALEEEKGTWNLQQLFEIALLMATGGDEKAVDAIRRRALLKAQADQDDWVGGEELIFLDGVGAVIDLARIYGRRLIRNSDAWPCGLDHLVRKPDVLAQSKKFLEELAVSDVEIRAYLTHWQKSLAAEVQRAEEQAAKSPAELQEAQRQRVRRDNPLGVVLRNAAARVGRYPGRYMVFGRFATAEELAVILQQLDLESEDDVCQRLLWVFRRAALPQISSKVWLLAQSSHRGVQTAALTALAQLQDDRVGELGRGRLRAERLAESDSETLDLFIRNYKAEDAVLIMEALQKLTPSPDEAHNLCSSLLDIAETNASPSVVPLLRWAYEETPCTNCRLRTVKLLQEQGQLPRDVVQECLFDASEDVQAFAQDLRAAG